MLDYVIGVIVFTIFLAMIAVGYVHHMNEVMKDIANTEAEEIAEQKFNEMKRNMQIRVRQRLEIIDEMGGDNG